MKYLLCNILASALLLSCSTTPSEENKTDSSANVPVTRAQSVGAIQPLRPNIDLTPWTGQLYEAIYWTDSRGENTVIISGNPQYFWEDENPDAKKFFPKDEDPETLSELTEIFATHYILKPGEAKWKEYYAYHDYMFGCCDVWMEYQPGSLAVLNADSNGTGEAIFMYHETEGDGKISNSWYGNMVLLIDSAQYVSHGASGFRNDAEPSVVVSDQLVWAAPATGPYPKVVEKQWGDLCAKWVQIQRDAITERNNVDEHGHADHVH
ncbi:MAG TPA: hypothetical protein VK826_17790 [Bacteroidia bacterium]|nr:hypothetical protein [Bacteroidia bacterium]